jgi:hypothetical protein
LHEKALDCNGGVTVLMQLKCNAQVSLPIWQQKPARSQAGVPPKKSTCPRARCGYDPTMTGPTLPGKQTSFFISLSPGIGYTFPSEFGRVFAGSSYVRLP